MSILVFISCIAAENANYVLTLNCAEWRHPYFKKSLMG